jgi:hypothetical protein
MVFILIKASPKAKSKKMSPTDPVEEEEKAEVEAKPRSEKEEENLGKAFAQGHQRYTPATVQCCYP